ncbi:MAG: CPBP family glutamic-type intramembrane protease [Kineosporiaceae bacterium]
MHGRGAAAAGWLRLGVVTAGLVVAVAARRAVDPWPGATSITAAAVFVVLAAGVAALDRRWGGEPDPARDVAPPWRRYAALPTRRYAAMSVGAGLVAAAALCVGPWLEHVRHPAGPLPPGELPVWVVAVTAVAVAQEALLRGSLWDAVAELGPTRTPLTGQLLALGVTTIAFAAVHVPFYGPSVLPVDAAAGLVLGGLRLLTGGLLAPATAHVAADLAGWWMP